MTIHRRRVRANIHRKYGRKGRQKVEPLGPDLALSEKVVNKIIPAVYQTRSCKTAALKPSKLLRRAEYLRVHGAYTSYE